MSAAADILLGCLRRRTNRVSKSSHTVRRPDMSEFNWPEEEQSDTKNEWIDSILLSPLVRLL